MTLRSLLRTKRSHDTAATGGDLHSLVASHLEALLLDEAFCKSHQSEKLLRYLVHNSLDGQEELLRERHVGVEVFGREAGYDTSSDPIVRVRVNEIRKRLSRYYLTPGSHDRIQFDIPPGSYRVQFHVRGDALPPALPAPDGISPRLVWGGVATAVVLAVAALWLGASPDALEQFWGPALQGKQPVLICAGHPVVYRFSPDFLRRSGKAPAGHYEYLTGSDLVPPDQPLFARDVVAIPDQYIGLGSAFAVAKFSSWLAGKHRESEIRFGNDISFNDLKRTPAVVVGAFQNRWTMELSKEGRLVLVTGTEPGIRDVKTGKVWNIPSLRPDGRTDEDYVLVKRLVHAETRRFVIALAGITQYGSQAGGELLTNAGAMEDLVKKLPAGWANRNLEILFHAPVIRGSPGALSMIQANVY